MKHVLGTIRNWLWRKRQWFLGVSAIVAAVAIGGGLFYAGYRTGIAEPHILTLKNVTDTEVPKSVGADFNIFWQTWDIIRENALKSDAVSDKNLVYSAAAGLLKSLDDPYSVFQKPSDAAKFNQDVQGNFGGVGMRIDVKDKQLIVLTPLKNSPSDRAGVKAGDKIIKINDTYSLDMDIDAAVKLIRGEVGTKVKVTLLRDSWSAPKEFLITREIIQVPTLDYSLKNGDVAYVQLYSFNNNAEQLFRDAIRSSELGKAKGLILDLRGNPGGFLNVAVRLAGWFVEQGKPVVTEEFRSGEKNIYQSPGGGQLKDFPLVVLVDGNSASAAEILAGALHDDRNAILVGEKTFGKGTVQELKNLTDGSQIKITVAHWLLPKGALIDKNGIEPDIKVPVTEKEIAEKRDIQLEKALEVIKKEIEKAK